MARVVGMDESRVRVLLDGLCEKGLVLDLWNGSRYDYFVSPMVIGIFEFTMMRTGGLDLAAASRLFRDYMFGDDSFFRKNFSRGETVSPMRAFPRGESVAPGDYAEVLDFEKAEHIISSSEKFAMGICSCRHEKLHLDEYRCGTPLETCSSLNGTAEYLIRHNLAREVTRSEMMDNLARSRDLGLVVTGDVTKRDVGFLCHCCGCCCNLLLGLSRFGYQGTVVTSGFIAAVEPFCNGCGRCVKACPVKAISLLTEDMGTCSKRSAVVDETICIGCGVCSASCARKALLLRKRKQRVYLPEDTLERVMMACLERAPCRTWSSMIRKDIPGLPAKLPGRLLQALPGEEGPGLGNLQVKVSGCPEMIWLWLKAS